MVSGSANSVIVDTTTGNFSKDLFIEFKVGVKLIDKIELNRMFI